jgi:hypothetical protein
LNDEIEKTINKKKPKKTTRVNMSNLQPES